MDRIYLFALVFVMEVLVTHAAPRAGYGVSGGGPYDPFYNAAQSDYGAQWRSFKSNTENVQKTLGARNPEAAKLIIQIQTNTLFLKGKWDEWFRKHNQPDSYNSRDGYLRGLQRNNRLLSRLEKEKSDDNALSILRDVTLDVQIKADNCRNSGDGLGKEIKAKVRTRAGEKEMGGYEVFFVQKGMFDVKNAHDRFLRQSSPTDERTLPPGGYAMWVRKSGISSEAVTMRIGGRGETKLEVDLEVPP